MKDDREKMLACPFCSCQPILDIHYEDASVNEETDSEIEFAVIRCSDCGYSKQRSSPVDLVAWWNTRTPSFNDAIEAAAKARAALFEPTESDAIYNLYGALIDIERLSAAGKPTDQVCIRTIKRVLVQIGKAHAALALPAPGGKK